VSEKIQLTGYIRSYSRAMAQPTLTAIRIDDLYLIGLLAVGVVPPVVGGIVGWAFGWVPALGLGVLVGVAAPSIPARLGLRVRRQIEVGGGPLPPERHQFLGLTLRRLLVRYLLDIGST